MKLRFYFDVWPGQVNTYGYNASTQPHKKSEGVRRLSFDVFVPDEILHDPDHHLSETTIAKLSSDYGEESS